PIIDSCVIAELRHDLIHRLPPSQICRIAVSFVFFFKDTPATEISTLSLHDALPIWRNGSPVNQPCDPDLSCSTSRPAAPSSTRRDRKSTRLNSSHVAIPYAVFCLQKKKRLPGQAVPNVRYESLARVSRRATSLYSDA